MNNCKVFLFSRSCSAGKNTLYYSTPISDRPKLPGLWPRSNAFAFDTGLGEVTINQDHSWLEGQVCRNGEGEMDWEQKGEDEWPWIKLWCRDVVQWAAVTVRYKAYDRFLFWKCITVLGLRPSKFSWVLQGIRNENSPSFHNCQLAFFPVACTQMFTLIHTLYSETDMHMHIYAAFHPPKHIHTCNKNMEFFFCPNHWYSHKTSTVVVTNMSFPMLQSTPDAECAGRICSVLSNTQTICIFPLFLFIQVLHWQWHVLVYCRFQIQQPKQNMHFN